MVMDILFVINAIVIVGFLLIWSLIVFRKKNYTLVEIGWPLSLVLATAVSFLIYGSSSIYRRLLVITVTIWGLRLAFSLYARHWNLPEGSRYAQMREKSDSKFSGIKAFVSLFIIPAIVFYIVSLPITIGFLDSQSILVWWQYAGLGLWALGVLIEMGTESQIRRFESKPENEGHLITKGFWRLSRHPHYFGTAIVWWGIFLISAVDWNNLLGILSPIVMTLYLVYLASRSPIEAEYQEREDLKDYTRKTPQFFPFVTQITAVLSGIGKVASKVVSSTRKDRKPSEEVELTEPVTENDPNPVLFTESTADTEWFKPEMAEDELASHNAEEVWGAEETLSANNDDLLVDEHAHDEATIDDILTDNEFSNEIDDSETRITEDEDIMPIEETVILVEEEELVDNADPLSEVSETDILEEADVTKDDVELPEETYDVVGEIPGSELELDVEPNSTPNEVEQVKETVGPVFEEEIEVEEADDTAFEKDVEDFVEGNKNNKNNPNF